MDIRIARGRNHHVWLWTALIVGIAVVALLAAAIFGDPTRKGTVAGVGAAANFGKDRAAVQPVVIEPFENVKRLTDRELGRIVHLVGTAESGVRRSAVYVRTPQGRRILVRFEPAPTPAQLRGVVNGGGVSMNGYLQKISRAEFNVWMDTLGVIVPRPKPGVKFGDLPDSNFTRIDSLFVKDYYISVRPEGIGRPGAPPTPAVVMPAAAPPADSAPTRPRASDDEPAAAPPVTEAETEQPVVAEPAGRDTVRP